MEAAAQLLKTMDHLKLFAMRQHYEDTLPNWVGFSAPTL